MLCMHKRVPVTPARTSLLRVRPGPPALLQLQECIILGFDLHAYKVRAPRPPSTHPPTPALSRGSGQAGTRPMQDGTGCPAMRGQGRPPPPPPPSPQAPPVASSQPRCVCCDSCAHTRARVALPQAAARGQEAAKRFWVEDALLGEGAYAIEGGVGVWHHAALFAWDGFARLGLRVGHACVWGMHDVGRVTSASLAGGPG